MSSTPYCRATATKCGTEDSLHVSSDHSQQLPAVGSRRCFHCLGLTLALAGLDCGYACSRDLLPQVWQCSVQSVSWFWMCWGCHGLVASALLLELERLAQEARKVPVRESVADGLGAASGPRRRSCRSWNSWPRKLREQASLERSKGKACHLIDLSIQDVKLLPNTRCLSVRGPSSCPGLRR